MHNKNIKHRPTGFACPLCWALYAVMRERYLVRLFLLFLCCFSSISYSKECSLSDVIHKENDFLHDALAEIVKYDPKVKNRLNLVQLSVLGTDLYFPNRYRVLHLEDGLSLSTDIRGRLNLYGCNLTEDLRLGFGGRISIGQIENCLHCSTPEKSKEKGIIVVEKQISDEIKLRLVTLESHKATIAYIFRGNMYLEILDSNQELYKYILFQLNGYK